MIKERIRECRIENSLTQQQVADLLGVTMQAICNYEKGIREPSIDTIKKMCKLFNVSADYLIGLTDY